MFFLAAGAGWFAFLFLEGLSVEEMFVRVMAGVPHDIFCTGKCWVDLDSAQAKQYF